MRAGLQGSQPGKMRIEGTVLHSALVLICSAERMKFSFLGTAATESQLGVLAVLKTSGARLRPEL